MKIKSLVCSLLLLPSFLLAQGPIMRNIVTTNTTPFVLGLMTNVSSTVTSNALANFTNLSTVVAQDAAQAVVNQKLWQDVSLTIRGYGERAFDADKVVFNDGTIGHRPGTGYGNVYMRDFLMTREGLPERVTLTESWNILNTFSNTFYQAGWFVDSVDAAKQPNATPIIAWNAFTNNGTTIINPALDCAFDFTHAMFMDYRQRGNPLSFTNHWLVASNGMNFIGWSNSAFTVIPSVYITNDLVYLDKVALLNSPTFKWFGEFGFNDGIPKSGYSLWLSLLRFRALNESSEMAAAAGQQTTASNLAYQARSCSTNLITYLWTSTNWFLSCTITNDVADAIGSAFAVWIGAVDKPHALLIASNCVATSPGGVAFATNPSLTNGAPYFPGAGNPWKYSPISSPGTSQNQTAWPGFAGMWNYCCALWDGGVAAQNWYTLASTYATWNGAPIEYLAKPGSGNGTTFYMQGAQALAFFDHVATDFQFRNFATNSTSASGFIGNTNQFTNSGGVTSIKGGVQLTNTGLWGSSTIFNTLVLSGLSEDLIRTKPLFIAPAGGIVGWSQNGAVWTNLQYNGLSPSAQQIITNIAFSFASGGTNLDLGNSTNLQFSGLSLTAQTDITNVTLNLLNGSNQLSAFSFYTNATESVYNVKAFGAKGDGVIVNRCGIMSGSTTLTNSVSGFKASMVGKQITIYGAGTNGFNLSTTVAGFGSASSITLSEAAGTSCTNHACVVGTDDTVAIQTAINVVSTNGGGTIFCPEGIYVIAGALQDASGGWTNHHYAQLFFPEIAQGHYGPSVTFRGPAPASSGGQLGVSDLDLFATGANFWSFLSRAESNNICRVLDVRNFNTPVTGDSLVNCWTRNVPAGQNMTVGLNNVQVNVKDMSWKTCHDANLICLDLWGAERCDIEDVFVDTGLRVAAYTNTPPSGTNGFGVIFPGGFNENVCGFNRSEIRGYYVGMDVACSVIGANNNIQGCLYGVSGFRSGGNPNMFYGLHVTATKYTFVSGPCQVAISVDGLRLEDVAVGWWNGPTLFTNDYVIPSINGRFGIDDWVTGSWPKKFGSISTGTTLDINDSPTLIPYVVTPTYMSNNVYVGKALHIWGNNFPTVGFGFGTTLGTAGSSAWDIYADGTVSPSILNIQHTELGSIPIRIAGDDSVRVGVAGKSTSTPGFLAGNSIGLTNLPLKGISTTNVGSVGQVLTFIDLTNGYWSTPTGGSGSATNALTIISTNNTTVSSTSTNLNFLSGNNVTLTASNHAGITDIGIGLPATVSFTAVNVGTINLTNPIPPEALAPTNGVTDGMALSFDHATNKWASISGGGGISGIGSTLSNTTLFGTTTFVSSNNPIIELFVTPGGIGDLLQVTNATGEKRTWIDANGSFHATNSAGFGTFGGTFTGDGAGLTNFMTNVILTVNIDGAGSVIQPGRYGGHPVAANNWTIIAWSITAMGASPTCTFDVWKTNYGTSLPTVSQTIMGTKPALSTGNAIYSTTLTSWVTGVTNKDIWGINLDACANATNITFELIGYR